MAEKIQISTEFERAVQFVFYTQCSVFLTGNAGTGKTTFLHYIRNNCPKKMAIIAPTGVAAMNATGVTIHSLFQLPVGTYIPNFHYQIGKEVPFEIFNQHSLLSKLKITNPKRELIKELELLVIDEVSMLRCDILDAIDTVLRHVRSNNLPFGGVQLLFIGDLLQLPPVVKHEEWVLMQSIYKSPYFFDANVIQQVQLVGIELIKIFRQKDEEFIRVLNHIRHNKVNDSDLKALQNCYDANTDDADSKGTIILTTHNAKADAINKTSLNNLKGKLYSYKADIHGDFPTNSYPTDTQLELKVGAQVMFIKNDKGDSRRYYNGKIATVSKITSSQIFVLLDDQLELPLEKENWNNIKLKYKPEDNSIEEEEIGSFSQYPIRLAWAITIHKSQGLTFNNAVVDAGASFVAGQVYVALSRLTSFKGLKLRTQINKSQIATDTRVLSFIDYIHNISTNNTIVLDDEIRRYAMQVLINTFEFEAISNHIKGIYQSLINSKIPEKHKVIDLFFKWFNTCEEHTIVAQKFVSQLKQILYNKAQPDYNFLYQRTQAASQYFIKFLKQIITEIDNHIQTYKIKTNTKKHITQNNLLLKIITRKQTQVEQAETIAHGLFQKENLTNLFKKLEQSKQIIIEHSKLELQQPTIQLTTKQISYDMFIKGMTIDEIAKKRNLKESTIVNHFTDYIIDGSIDIFKIVDKSIITTILDKLQTKDETTLAKLKEDLPEYITYAQIRLVQAYFKRNSILA